MAIGLALIFNIKLPINFNSPYKAVSIQDFWRRWHITLSTWLKDYIYIPLGGNRKGTNSAMLNVFITFLIGGIWHGAGWNFIMWGAFHGMALAAHRLWSRSGLSMPRPIGWLLTILFVNFAWVFFRAEDMNTAITVVNEMVSFNLNTSGLSLLIGASISIPLLSSMYSSVAMAIFLCMVLIGTLAMRNSLEITKYAEDSYNLPFKVVVFYGSLLGLTSLSMFLTSSSKFLYFNF
jgi:D-alanyl-lipoteichoic acid acyltransferase DltB (MBOAT superfamily)